MGLDSDVKAFIDAQVAAAEADPPPPVSEQTAADVRNSYGALAEVLGVGEDVATVDGVLPGPGGDLRYRSYRPHGSGELPILVYYHGGGFTAGDLETHDHMCRMLCAGSGCLIVAVDYRLAPEHPFPAALDDAIAAYEWVVANASSLGGDGSRVGVGGDSAGGNLAAAVCLVERDRSGRQPDFQLLLYPGVDQTMSAPSIEELSEGYWLTREMIEWFVDQYVPTRDDRHNPYASPLLAASHESLAPATVISAEFDPLRDEAAFYVDKLTAAGVPATLIEFPGAIHAFIQLAPMMSVGQRGADEAAKAIKTALATPT
jgi:acetyl esterase